MSRTQKQAVAWARARVGDYGWDNLCLSFVRQAFGVYYTPDSEWPTTARNAGTAWDRAKRKHRETDPMKIPFGVPVFFEMPTVADHVALSTGDGRCISNDFHVDGRIDPVRIADIARHWGPLQGWTEDLVGNTVWTPPKPPKPEPEFTVVKFQLSPLQFGDTDEQMTSDVETLLSRDKHVFAGTEAGGEKAKPLPDLLRAAAKRHNLRFHMGKGDWLAVDRQLITGGWKDGYIPVLESHEGVGRHTDRGVVWASFETKDLGRIAVGSGHYLTNGRNPGDPNYKLNLRYANAVGDWAVEMGKGSDKVFWLGDQNTPDQNHDSFHGNPLTSCWDELGKYEPTFGRFSTLDVIASYDQDGAVEALDCRALDDKELRLHIDHYVTEAEYKVRHLKH
jgi:hypothetical protein